MKKDLVIIFDLDGTLLNTDLLIRQSFEHVFHKYKPDYVLSDEEHLSFLGPTLVASFRKYFPEELIQELVECYRTYNLGHHEDYVTIYPTVKETLDFLKSKGYPLAVVTTKKKDVALLGLELFQIKDYFDVILGMDDVKQVKPHPEGILRVLDETKCQRAIMIGDNVSDIMAGKNADVYTIGVKWSPKGTKEMEQVKPDLMIDEMKEVIGFVERVNEMLDLLVIGAGPAGLTAALYASRAGASVIVLDGGAPGGKLNLTAEIENYPGMMKKGPELAYSMYEQCLSFGAKYEYGEVTRIEQRDDHQVVYVGDKEYEAKYVFIATGTKERKMNIPNELEMSGRGVSYCAVCDGPFFKNKVVTVVGGGNSAIEEAIYLSDIAAHVHVVVRRDVLRADQYLVDKLTQKDNIEMHYLKKPHEVEVTDNKVSGLIVEDSLTQALSTIPTDGIFPFIGLDPISDFVKDLGIVNERGYIEVDENQETKIKGIFAGGDVTEKNLRQVITAANDGAIAGQYVASLLK